MESVRRAKVIMLRRGADCVLECKFERRQQVVVIGSDHSRHPRAFGGGFSPETKKMQMGVKVMTPRGLRPETVRPSFMPGADQSAKNTIVNDVAFKLNMQ